MENMIFDNGGRERNGRNSGWRESLLSGALKWIPLVFKCEIMSRIKLGPNCKQRTSCYGIETKERKYRFDFETILSVWISDITSLNSVPSRVLYQFVIFEGTNENKNVSRINLFKLQSFSYLWCTKTGKRKISK